MLGVNAGKIQVENPQSYFKSLTDSPYTKSIKTRKEKEICYIIRMIILKKNGIS